MQKENNYLGFILKSIVWEPASIDWDASAPAQPWTLRTGIQNVNPDFLKLTWSSETLHFVNKQHFRDNY